MLEAMLPEDPWDLMQMSGSASERLQLGQQHGTPLTSMHQRTSRSFSLYSSPSTLSTESCSADAGASVLDTLDLACSAGDELEEREEECSCLSLTMLQEQLQKQSKQSAIWSYSSDGCTPDVSGWARALPPPAPPPTPSPTAKTCTPSFTRRGAGTLSVWATPFQPSMQTTGSGRLSAGGSSRLDPAAPQTP